MTTEAATAPVDTQVRSGTTTAVSAVLEEAVRAQRMIEAVVNATLHASLSRPPDTSELVALTLRARQLITEQAIRDSFLVTERVADRLRAAISEVMARTALAPEVPPAAATERPSPDYLFRVISAAFGRARDERFEDGMATRFSRTLIAFIEAYGNAGVRALELVLDSEDTNAEVTAEALRWLPFVKDKDSYKYRLNLLEKGLRSQSARIRDAAGAGLAELNDPRTSASLEEAIAKEQCEDLQEDLRAVLNQLTNRCLGS